MATIKCEGWGCKNDDSSGKIFYKCDKCHRWWCSDHGYEGKRCPGCGKGVLKR